MREGCCAKTSALWLAGFMGSVGASRVRNRLLRMGRAFFQANFTRFAHLCARRLGKIECGGIAQGRGKSGPFGRSASYAVFRILRAFYDVFKGRFGKRVADCGVDSRPYASGPAGF